MPMASASPACANSGTSARLSNWVMTSTTTAIRTGVLDVLAGVITRRQHLDGDQPEQADAVAHQRHGGLLHVAVGERAVVVEHRHQRLGKTSAAPPRRARPAAPPAAGPSRASPSSVSASSGRLGRRQLRHQHHAQRHAQQGGGKLHQPVGIGEPAHAAGRQVRGDLRVDEQRRSAPRSRPAGPAPSARRCFS